MMTQGRIVCLEEANRAARKKPRANPFQDHTISQKKARKTKAEWITMTPEGAAYRVNDSMSLTAPNPTSPVFGIGLPG